MIRLLKHLIVLVVTLATGLAGGGAAGLLTQHPSPLGRRAAAPPEETSTIPPRPGLEPVVPDTLLAWTPGGLPEGFRAKVADLPGVDHVVGVSSGTAWLDGSAASDGSAVDRPPSGLAIPVEVAGAELERYAPFLPPADQTVLPLLAKGQAALGQTSARLRGLSRGATLEFGSKRIRVAGILPDTAIGAHEIFVSAETANALGVSRERYLLIDPAPGAARRDLSRAIRGLLPPGFLLQMRGPGETTYFRQGDAVLPPVRLKELFGEFAARPTTGGFIDPDPAWVGRNIVTAEIPVIGRVRCHRALIPQLRGALGELSREGLSGLIESYSGCFSARYINRNPGSGALSHHSWGVALDLNAGRNPFGQTPHQDPRLVAIFERWGFTWGGHWLLPDGNHFEFISFAPGA